MRRIFIAPIVTILFFLLLQTGCNQKPADVPELFPCSITVTKGDAPISDVEVFLGSTDSGAMHASYGITNSSGTATISTKRLSWQGAGVPAGEHVITLSKSPTFKPSLTVTEFQKLPPEKQEEYNQEETRRFNSLKREIPESLSEYEYTPYRITIVPGQENSLSIDISGYSEKKKKK